MFVIVPGKVYACAHISFPISGDDIMFFEDIADIMGMFFFNIF